MFLLIGILLLHSCKKESNESPVASQNNEREIAGGVWLNTNGVTQYDNINNVTILVGDKSTTTDSVGNWRIKGLFPDSVDITIKKQGYGTYIAKGIHLLFGKITTLSQSVTLFNLPDYSITNFTITPFLKNGISSQGLNILVDVSSPPRYPDLRKFVIFFNKDSIVSSNSKEYLFQLEGEFPGRFNEYWISSEENKKQNHLVFNQTLYAVAYPVTGWSYAIDNTTGRKEYFNVGSGKSNIIKFALP